MKIEILGTGCYNCARLESLVDQVLHAMGKSNVQVVPVSDEQRTQQHMTLDEVPGLVIHSQLASAKELPARETLLQWLMQAAQFEDTAAA